MFDFKLLEKEEVEIVSDHTLIKYHDSVQKVSTVITNKRLLILDYPKDVESFRFGKEVPSPMKKEILFETELENIISIQKESDFDKYILKDTNYFYLNDDTVTNYLLKLI